MGYKKTYISIICKFLWCPEPESNQRHEDFQSSALPTELSGLVMVGLQGLEPRTCRL